MGFTAVPVEGFGKSGMVSLAIQNNKYYIRFPRRMFGGQQKTLSLELEATDKNRPLAEAKLRAVQNDLDLDRFDYSLESYRPKHRKQDYLQLVKEKPKTISLLELWDRFYSYTEPSLKHGTRLYYQTTIKPKLVLYSEYKGSNLNLFDAIALREFLLKTTTKGMTKRCLTYVNKAVCWGIKNNLIDLQGRSNPYADIASDIHFNYQDNPNPCAFSIEEEARLIKNFEEQEPNYANLVKFLFLTGCRPSEAIGLKWDNIPSDYQYINFSGSFFKGEYSDKSKTNRQRRFPVNAELEALLRSIGRKDGLVFPSPLGNPINYANFSRRQWNKIADGIKPDTTPYSARDSFITKQILAGVSTSLISKWCDTSSEVIERYYFDTLNISHIKPV